MRLKKICLGLLLLCGCSSWLFAQESKRTVLSAQIEGYKRDMIYMSCIQSPDISGEFHTNPGESHVLDFQTDEPVAIVVNGRTTIFMQPGDSIHTQLVYEGTKVTDIRFSGTDRAVANNNLYQDVQRLRLAMKYRTQLLGLVVLDVKPLKRFQDSKLLLSRVDAMIAKAGERVDKSLVDYLKAEIEGLAYLSYVEYPVMYADTRKVPIEKQEIGDYWSVMDSIALRDDVISLSSPSYVGFLMRYALFLKEKKAHEEGKSYAAPQKLEDMYKLFAETFEGRQRDYVLFALLKNFTQGGKELERVDPLFADYKNKYNTNPKHIKYLESMLQ